MRNATRNTLRGAEGVSYTLPTLQAATLFTLPTLPSVGQFLGGNNLPGSNLPCRQSLPNQPCRQCTLSWLVSYAKTHSPLL